MPLDPAYKAGLAGHLPVIVLKGISNNRRPNRKAEVYQK